MTAPRPRAIGYVRVSTLDQVDRGQGIEIQEAAIREYCRFHRIVLLDLVGDEGISGSSGLAGRMALAGALTRIDAGEASSLVVYRLDRLARDLLLQETVIEWLRQGGASVVSVSEPDVDSEDPIRVLIRQVLGALAQYEKSLIKGRMAAGRRAKAARGGFIGGIPKYGYRADRHELSPEPDEQAAIGRMLSLHGQGASLRDIGRVLEEAGHAPKCGGRWHPTPIQRILNRNGCRTNLRPAYRR